MECPECGSDRFSVIRVWRQRKHSDKGEPVYNSLYDMRRVICDACGTIYITETQILYSEQYDKTTMKKRRVQPQEIKRRLEQDAKLF